MIRMCSLLVLVASVPWWLDAEYEGAFFSFFLFFLIRRTCGAGGVL